MFLITGNVLALFFSHQNKFDISWLRLHTSRRYCNTWEGWLIKSG